MRTDPSRAVFPGGMTPYIPARRVPVGGHCTASNPNDRAVTAVAVSPRTVTARVATDQHEEEEPPCRLRCPAPSRNQQHVPASLPPRAASSTPRIELFYNEGIRSVGIDRLIGASTVTKATFYKHYGSKDRLVTEYVHNRHRLAAEHVWALAEHHDDLEAYMRDLLGRRSNQVIDARLPRLPVPQRRRRVHRPDPPGAPSRRDPPRVDQLLHGRAAPRDRPPAAGRGRRRPDARPSTARCPAATPATRSPRRRRCTAPSSASSPRPSRRIADAAQAAARPPRGRPGCTPSNGYVTPRLSATRQSVGSAPHGAVDLKGTS